MAAFSGASGNTTSMKSPAPMPGSPITLMVRPSCAQNALSASQIKRRRKASSLPKPGARALARKSKVSSICEAASAGSTRRRSLLRLSATARTWAVRSSSERNASGTTPPGTASAASAASWAAVRRSLSQVMRKLATDGTKMSTSASMTKLTVSSSSFADKPRPRRSAVARNGERMRLARSHSLDDQARASSMLSRGTTLSRSSHAGLSELAQPANDLAHQGVSGRRRIITVGDTLVYLAKRRIGRNPLRHGLDIEPLGHRKRPHLDQLASMLANHAGAEDAALGVGHDLDEAFGRALGVGAIVLVVGPAVDAHAPAALFGRILAEPHLGDLWVGESCPWDDGAVHRRRLAEQGPAQHDAGMVIGDVRELGAADHVADGKHPRVRSQEAPAHLDAAFVVLDTRSLKVETGNVGLPPGGNEKVGTLHEGRHAVLRDVHIDEPHAAGDALHQRAFTYLQALRAQPLQHHLGYFRVVLAQRLHGLQHR